MVLIQATVQIYMCVSTQVKAVERGKKWTEQLLLLLRRLVRITSGQNSGHESNLNDSNMKLDSM